MTKILSSLKGYVAVKIWGYSPERFMNLCSSKGILLWDVKNHGSYYTLCMHLKDFYRLKPIVHKTGTRVSITERHGLPFFVPLMKARKVFGIGFAACFLFLILMSRYVWAFTFTGNTAITDDVLLDFLKENGVDYGTLTKEVDIEGLEKKIREQFQEVTWTSIQIEGTRLFVKLKENDLLYASETEQKEEGDGGRDETAGSDLIAGQDGVITDIITRRGVPQVKAGDEVKKGDVLVAGAVPVYGEDTLVKNYQYYEADADIRIRFAYPVQETLEFAYETESYTGRVQKQYFLEFFGKEYILGRKSCPYLKYDQVGERHQFHLFDRLYLPFYAGVKCNREYLPVETVYSKEQAKTILLQRFQKLIQTLEEKGVQIIEKDVKIEKNRKKMTLKGTMAVIAPAGERVPLTQIPAEKETDGTDTGTDTDSG